MAGLKGSIYNRDAVIMWRAGILRFWLLERRACSSPLQVSTSYFTSTGAVKICRFPCSVFSSGMLGYQQLQSGDKIQGLIHAKQVFYHRATPLFRRADSNMAATTFKIPVCLGSCLPWAGRAVTLQTSQHSGTENLSRECHFISDHHHDQNSTLELGEALFSTFTGVVGKQDTACNQHVKINKLDITSKLKPSYRILYL